MRIGVNGRFYGARPTGVQRFARELVRRLARRAEVTVFLPREVGADPDLPGEAGVARGRLKGRVWEQLELPRLAPTVDVVLHPANVAPTSGPRGVLVLHDVLPFTAPGSYRPLYRAWAGTVGRAGALRSRAVVTVSRWSAEEIVRVLGIPRDRVTVVPQGAAPLDAPASPGQVERALERHGLRRPYFLSVSGADPRKGGELLGAVWGALPADRGATLAVVGGGYRAVHRAGPVGPAPGIRRLGHVPDEDLRALYTGAVALLFPSTGEGFGRPPLEAMACGTRVAVTDYGPAREVLGDAADILPWEAAAWARAVTTLLDEGPAERAERVEEGRRRAAGFSWEAAADEVARVCRAAAEGGP